MLSCGSRPLSHLSLGGVNVDVEVVTGHGYSQVHEGVRALGEDVSVGRLDGLLDRGALHQAVVDEEDEVGPLNSTACAARKARGRGRGGENNKGSETYYTTLPVLTLFGQEGIQHRRTKISRTRRQRRSMAWHGMEAHAHGHRHHQCHHRHHHQNYDDNTYHRRWSGRALGSEAYALKIQAATWTRRSDHRAERERERDVKSIYLG